MVKKEGLFLLKTEFRLCSLKWALLEIKAVKKDGAEGNGETTAVGPLAWAREDLIQSSVGCNARHRSGFHFRYLQPES